MLRLRVFTPETRQRLPVLYLCYGGSRIKALILWTLDSPPPEYKLPAKYPAFWASRKLSIRWAGSLVLLQIVVITAGCPHYDGPLSRISGDLTSGAPTIPEHWFSAVSPSKVSLHSGRSGCYHKGKPVLNQRCSPFTRGSQRSDPYNNKAMAYTRICHHFELSFYIGTLPVWWLSHK